MLLSENETQAITRRRPTAWQVLAIGTLVAAVALLAASMFQPWASVSTVTEGLEQVTPGQPPQHLIGVYRLADFAHGATITLVARLAVLVGLAVFSVVRPDRRRRLLGVAAGVAAWLLITIADAGRLAVTASGLHDDYLTGSLESGALLAAAGTVLLVLVLVAPFLPRLGPAAVPDGYAPLPPPAAESSDATGVPPAGPGTEFQWSARPVVQPWWRRRRLVVTLGSAAVVVVLLVGGAAWLVAHQPPAGAADPRDLLVSAPVGSAPCRGQVSTDRRLARTDVSALLGETAAELLGQAGYQTGVQRCWVDDGDSETVAVLRFDSPSHAHAMLTTVARAAEQVTGAGARALPRIPGGMVSAGTAGTRTLAIATGQRGSMVFLVSVAEQHGADDAKATMRELLFAMALAQQQYNRL